MADVRRASGAFGTPAELVASCRRLRRHLELRELATAEEIAAHWPAEEDESALWPWVATYGQLMRLKGRGGAAAALPSQSEAERAALAALREEPEDVLLSDGSLVAVHPKGFDALTWMDDRDWYLAWLADRRARVIAAIDSGELPDGADPFALMERVRAEELIQLASMAAQLVHPGPALCAELPAADLTRWRAAAPADLVRIQVAGLHVNGNRIVLARRLSPVRKPRGAATTGWAGFLAGVAHRERRTPLQIARDRSLAALLVTYDLAAPSDSDAEDALT